MAGTEKKFVPPWMKQEAEKAVKGGKAPAFTPCKGCKNPAACKKAGKCLAKKGK